MAARRRSMRRRVVVPLWSCPVHAVVGATMRHAVNAAKRQWPTVDLGDDVAQNAGYAITLPEPFGGVLILLPASATIGTLAHECTHAAVFVLGRAGVRITAQDHEALAYTVDHIVGDLAPWLTQAREQLLP